MTLSSPARLIRLTVVLTCLLTASPAWSAGADGEPAPDFTLKSNQDANLRLSEYRGQVVLLNFWASWCGPCRQEMPLLDDIHEKYSPLGFTVLGVNVDKDISLANETLEDIPVDFPVLYDPTGKVSEAYDVTAMPTTVIIDRDGNMRFLHRGYKPGYEDDYIAQVKKLIRE